MHSQNTDWHPVAQEAWRGTFLLAYKLVAESNLIGTIAELTA